MGSAGLGRKAAAVAALVVVAATRSPAQVGTTPTLFALDPRASFYHASDPGAAPTVVDLTGVPTGAMMFLFPVGYLEVYGGSSVYYDARGNQPWGFSGTFSATNTLAPYAFGSHASRVPDAIASGLPQFTSFVAPDGRVYDTDIPHDFRIDQPLAVLKPAGASYLFLSVVDDQYWDNHTQAPDQLGVYVAARTDGTIPQDPNPHNLVPPYTAPRPGGSPPPTTTTPEPMTVALFAAGLFAVGAFRRPRRSATE